MIVDYVIDSACTNKTEIARPLYTYVMSGDGVHILAANRFIGADILIAPAVIRGIFNAALRDFMIDPELERVLVFTWEDGYKLFRPEQMVTESRVKYQPLDNAVLEMHSHGTMRPFFSSTDDEDEQGLRIYGVVGDLRSWPCQIRLRVGVYGYFQAVRFEDVFDGPCPIEEVE